MLVMLSPCTALAEFFFYSETFLGHADFPLFVLKANNWYLGYAEYTASHSWNLTCLTFTTPLLDTDDVLGGVLVSQSEGQYDTLYSCGDVKKLISYLYLKNNWRIPRAWWGYLICRLLVGPINTNTSRLPMSISVKLVEFFSSMYQLFFSRCFCAVPFSLLSSVF